MANYTLPNLTSAVVGFATTSMTTKQLRFAKVGLDLPDGVGVTSEKILELDSMDPLSYNGIKSNRHVGIGTTSKWYDTGSPQNNATFFGSYSFDGRSIVFADTGYANLTDTDEFTFAGDFAVEVSFNMTGTPDPIFPSALIASWSIFGSSDNKFILFANSSLNLVMQINGEGNTYTYPYTISLNTDHHVVITRREGIIKWWLDGQLGSEFAYAAAIEPTLDYRIGSYSAGAIQSFEGAINLVRMYRDRSLSDIEVRSLYDQQINRTPISETNGTIRVPNYNLNITSAVPAFEPNRPVTGQLYPRFTK